MADCVKGRLIFCTGGRRSGKSAYALSLTEGFAPKVFIATAEGRDAEMRQRILAHKRERGPEWTTLEIPVASALNLPDFVQRAAGSGGVLLLDCLSTWVSGCMEVLSSPRDAAALADRVLRLFAQVLRILRQSGVRGVLVSAESGLGLSPLTEEGRLFADLLGKVNQLAARHSDEAYFVVSSLPLRLK
jgi:adenosylcobinamide kinase/adenosylcobinamide-phosphate guanylyltransferase